MSVLLHIFPVSLFFLPRNFPVPRRVTAPTVLYLCSYLFRRMVDSGCDIRHLYSEKQTHHSCSSHAISWKTSLPATREIDCKRQIAFSRKTVLFLFFSSFCFQEQQSRKGTTGNLMEVMRKRSCLCTSLVQYTFTRFIDMLFELFVIQRRQYSCSRKYKQ